jgi:hypothetical protein
VAFWGSQCCRATAYTVLYTEGYHWFKSGWHFLDCGLVRNTLRINTLRQVWRPEAERKNNTRSHINLHRGSGDLVNLGLLSANGSSACLSCPYLIVTQLSVTMEKPLSPHNIHYCHISYRHHAERVVNAKSVATALQASSTRRTTVSTHSSGFSVDLERSLYFVSEIHSAFAPSETESGN